MRRKRISGQVLHNWINWPNSSTIKCTKCGCIKKTVTVNRKTIATYEFNNKIYTEWIPCKKD